MLIRVLMLHFIKQMFIAFFFKCVVCNLDGVWYLYDIMQRLYCDLLQLMGKWFACLAGFLFTTCVSTVLVSAL